MGFVDKGSTTQILLGYTLHEAGREALADQIPLLLVEPARQISEQEGLLIFCQGDS